MAEWDHPSIYVSSGGPSLCFFSHSSFSISSKTSLNVSSSSIADDPKASQMATQYFNILLLLHCLCSRLAHSHFTVKYLPGFHGPLPFHLETGYVGVGDSEEVQLFYYFIKSGGDPQNDPLVLWHFGGPGCSGLIGLAIVMGPLMFKLEQYNGSLPTLLLNPYSWTKKVNMLFMDLPVGTGFSYATTPQAFKTGDLNQAQHSHQFLRKWLIDHPKFISNPFYVGADSYAGLIAPMVVQDIIDGNKHTHPFVNFQGYILGNPVTIRSTYRNFAIPFAHRMTLISDELFESLERSCKGEYMNFNPSNVECLTHYNTFKKCTSRVASRHILLSDCPERASKRRSLHSISKQFFSLEGPFPPIGCPVYVRVLFYHWTNDDQVRKALQIRQETVKEWKRCDRNSLDYNYDVDDVFPYHINISKKGYHSLIYSGDHDMPVSHLDTHSWIRSLNSSIVDAWRPWFIDDIVAGYVTSYANNMTLATIKGGGHTSEYTHRECSIMFDRWISGESL